MTRSNGRVYNQVKNLQTGNYVWALIDLDHNFQGNTPRSEFTPDKDQYYISMNHNHQVIFGWKYHKVNKLFFFEPAIEWMAVMQVFSYRQYTRVVDAVD